jgi:hypothetical protein
MVATRAIVGEPSKPGGNRQAGVFVSDINSPGHAFRGVFYGVLLGVFLWAGIITALL